MREANLYEIYVLRKWVARYPKLAVSSAMLMLGTVLWITLRETKLGQGIVLLFTGALLDDVWRFVRKLIQIVF